MSALADRREAREVLRRHDRAMSVVERVDDTDARWELLRYVVLGNPTVDAALRGSRNGRVARVLALRDAGWTYQRIADELGYADLSGPHKVCTSRDLAA